MTSAPSLEFIAVANPFAALMDLPSGMEAHERLARLPQHSHRLDGLMVAKDLGRCISDVARSHDCEVVTEMGDLDDLGTPAGLCDTDTSDIIRVSEVELQS